MDGLSSTSLSLLEGLKARDQVAWQRLTYLYYPLVYGWCRRRGLQARDAEDVVQEVFLTVARKIQDFRREREGDTFRGWLWTIARHKLGDWIRHQRVQEKTFGAANSQERLQEIIDPGDADSDSALSHGEAGGLYHRALTLIRAEFEERSWLAFWRVAVEGQDPADVARELLMSRNAVYVAKSRILARLRELLGDPI